MESKFDIKDINQAGVNVLNQSPENYSGSKDSRCYTAVIWEKELENI